MLRIAVVNPGERVVARSIALLLRHLIPSDGTVHVDEHSALRERPDLAGVDALVISTYCAELGWGRAESAAWIDARLDEGMALFPLNAGVASEELLAVLARHGVPLKRMPAPLDEMRQWLEVEVLPRLQATADGAPAKGP